MRSDQSGGPSRSIEGAILKKSTSGGGSLLAGLASSASTLTRTRVFGSIGSGSSSWSADPS